MLFVKVIIRCLLQFYMVSIMIIISKQIHSHSHSDIPDSTIYILLSFVISIVKINSILQVTETTYDFNNKAYNNRTRMVCYSESFVICGGIIAKEILMSQKTAF